MTTQMFHLVDVLDISKFWLLKKKFVLEDKATPFKDIQNSVLQALKACHKEECQIFLRDSESRYSSNRYLLSHSSKGCKS